MAEPDTTHDACHARMQWLRTQATDHQVIALLHAYDRAVRECDAQVQRIVGLENEVLALKDALWRASVRTVNRERTIEAMVLEIERSARTIRAWWQEEKELNT